MGFRDTLNSPALDFDHRPYLPELTYGIATYMRTGGTWLCKQLWETGGLGAPWEYQLSHWWKNRELGDLMNRRTSPNGVFGVKLLPWAVPDPWPNVQKWVHLTRRDATAKAVSELIAVQTQSFWSEDLPVKEPVYSALQIANLLVEYAHQQFIWRRFFEQNDIVPLELVYEDLGPHTVDEVADFLGVDLTGCEPVRLPPVERQASTLNAEWIDRFTRQGLQDISQSEGWTS